MHIPLSEQRKVPKNGSILHGEGARVRTGPAGVRTVESLGRRGPTQWPTLRTTGRWNEDAEAPRFKEGRVGRERQDLGPGSIRKDSF